MVKIEQLTQKLNEFISAFNSHTHEIPTGVVAVAGSATAQSNPLRSWFRQSRANTRASRYRTTRMKSETLIEWLEC